MLMPTYNYRIKLDKILFDTDWSHKWHTMTLSTSSKMLAKVVKVIWMFPKIGVPQNRWFIKWKTLVKLMIWGYHYFWKHPYASGWKKTCFYLNLKGLAIPQSMVCRLSFQPRISGTFFPKHASWMLHLNIKASNHACKTHMFSASETSN